MTQSVPEPLASVLDRFYHVNTMRANWARLIGGFIDSGLEPEWPALFRRQLADAILNGAVSPKQYEMLTGDDLGDPDEIREALMEIWTALYGDEPVAMG